MSEGAYVGSFEAVRDFRAALHTFLQEVREAMCSYDLEVRRTLDWLLEAQPKRWQQEVRNCDETIAKAKIDLERCRNSKLPGGGTPSCMEERKALERARHRRQYALDKIESVRKWGYVLGREAEEYTGRAHQLSGMFDADLPQAIATLDRVLSTLEAYAALNHPDQQATAASVLATAELASVSRPIDAPAETGNDANRDSEAQQVAPTAGPREPPPGPGTTDPRDDTSTQRSSEP
jgi:hypothetical protein